MRPVSLICVEIATESPKQLINDNCSGYIICKVYTFCNHCHCILCTIVGLYLCCAEYNYPPKLQCTVSMGGGKSPSALMLKTHHVHVVLADISLSCQVPGLLMTCSTDDCIKFWDIHVRPATTCMLLPHLHSPAFLLLHRPSPHPICTARKCTW